MADTAFAPAPSTFLLCDAVVYQNEVYFVLGFQGEMLQLCEDWRNKSKYFWAKSTECVKYFFDYKTIDEEVPF